MYTVLIFEFNGNTICLLFSNCNTLPNIFSSVLLIADSYLLTHNDKLALGISSACSYSLLVMCFSIFFISLFSFIFDIVFKLLLKVPVIFMSPLKKSKYRYLILLPKKIELNDLYLFGDPMKKI